MEAPYPALLSLLLRRSEAIDIELGPSRWAKATDSQHCLPLLVRVTEAIIPSKREACGTPSAHPGDHLTMLVVRSHNAVVLRRRPTLRTSIANLLHGLPLIAGRAEAVIALTCKALRTGSAYFHKGTTGVAALGGKAVAAGSDMAHGTAAMVGQRSYGLLGPGRVHCDQASSH